MVVYKSITSSLTTEEIVSRIDQLDREVLAYKANINKIASLHKSIEQVKSGTTRTVTKEEKEKLDKELDKVKKIYYTRKKLVRLQPIISIIYLIWSIQYSHMTGMIQEGLGMSGWHELVEKLGIEEDPEEFKRVVE